MILNHSDLFDIIDNIKCVCPFTDGKHEKRTAEKGLLVGNIEHIKGYKDFILSLVLKSCIEIFNAHMHKHTQAPTYYQCASIVEFYRSDRWKWWRNGNIKLWY